LSRQDKVDIYSASEKIPKKHRGGRIALIIIVILLVLIILTAAWIWFFNRGLIKDFLPVEETQPASAQPTTVQPTTALQTTEPETVAEIEVPNVGGYKAKDAYYKLNSVGLKYTVVREYSDDVYAEYVLSQEPEPGEIIKQSDRVVLHISKGIDHPPESTTAPNQSATAAATKPGNKNKSGKYILDGSDKRIIGKSEVYKLDENEMTLALNEIFARYGRRFNSPEIQAYFNKQDWYKGTISPSDFDEDVISSTERANVNTILEVMKEKGYR
jgi:hypothetical protein